MGYAKGTEVAPEKSRAREPRHAAARGRPMMPSWWRRTCYRLFGHSWVEDQRGAPVIPVFIVCMRCRKFDRIRLYQGAAR
jgi:hypothetical protein